MSKRFPFKFVEVEPTVELREEDGFRRGPPGAGPGGNGVGKHPKPPKSHRTIWMTEPGNWIALPGFEEKLEEINKYKTLVFQKVLVLGLAFEQIRLNLSLKCHLQKRDKTG